MGSCTKLFGFFRSPKLFVKAHVQMWMTSTDSVELYAKFVAQNIEHSRQLNEWRTWIRCVACSLYDKSKKNTQREKTNFTWNESTVRGDITDCWWWWWLLRCWKQLQHTQIQFYLFCAEEWVCLSSYLSVLLPVCVFVAFATFGFARLSGFLLLRVAFNMHLAFMVMRNQHLIGQRSDVLQINIRRIM